MTKIYQDRFGLKGNCMQATTASILDLRIEDVPYFKGKQWFKTFYSFLKKQECQYERTIYNPQMLGEFGDGEGFDVKVQESEGINGLFLATVFSPGMFKIEAFLRGKMPTTHSVIVNKKLEIVHDPHPAYKRKKNYPLYQFLDYHGIITVWDIKKIKKD